MVVDPPPSPPQTAPIHTEGMPGLSTLPLEMRLAPLPLAGQASDATRHTTASSRTAAALAYVEATLAHTEAPAEVRAAALQLRANVLSTTARRPLALDEASVALQYAMQLAGQPLPPRPLEPVPGHVPLLQEQRSANAWVTGEFVQPTLSSARSAAAAAAGEALGSSASVRGKPDIASPEELHLGTEAPAMQPRAPLREFPPPVLAQHAAAFDGLAICTQHSAYCSTCAATYLSSDFEAWRLGSEPWLPGGGVCYANTMVHHATAHEPAWIDKPPACLPARAHSVADVVSPGDAHLDPHVAKLEARGIITDVPPGTQVTTATVFIVTKYMPEVSPRRAEEIADRALTPAGGSMGVLAALRLAAALSVTFMASLQAGVTAAAAVVSGAAEAVLRAPAYATIWGAAMASTLVADAGRLVIDLHEVNQAVASWGYRLSQLHHLLSFIGPGAWLCKADAKGGYYHVRLHPNAYRFYAFKHRGRTLAYTRLPMGYGPAGAIFGWVTSEVNSWLHHQGVRASIVYIDDFLIAGATSREAQEALDMLRAFCKHIGLELNPEKTEGPAQRMVMLGLCIDTLLCSINVPAAKLVKTLFSVLVALECHEQKCRVPVAFLASLGGSIVWLTRVNSLLRPFTRPISDMVVRRHHRGFVYVGAEVATALKFLREQADAGRLVGECLLPSPAVRPQLTMAMTSDACGDGRFAVRCGGAVIYGTVADGHTYDIVLLELLAVVAGVARLGFFMPHAIIIAGVDNAGVAYWLNAGQCARRAALQCLCVLFASLESNKQVLLGRWLSRWFNYLTDRVCDSLTLDLAREWAPEAVHRHVADPRTALAEWAAASPCMPAGFIANAPWRKGDE